MLGQQAVSGGERGCSRLLLDKFTWSSATITLSALLLACAWGPG